MHFLNSTLEDLNAIFHLYDLAIAFQKKISDQHWLPFELEMVKKESDARRNPAA